MKFLLIAILLLFFSLDRDRARQAYQHYQDQNYELAERGFREALESSPNDPRLWYNLGNALAQQGKAEEAQRAWQRFQSLEPDARERARADHNLGNILSDQEEYQKALEAYRNALRNAPDDPDTRHNFELARRMIQEQEQQEQQQDQQQDQSQAMPQDGEQQQGQPQEGDQQADQQPQQGSPEDQDPSQQGQPEVQPGDLSLEDADNMLNALDNIERDLIRDFQQRQMDPSERNEKDW